MKICLIAALVAVAVATPPRRDCEEVCPSRYDPVCANGVTYSNRCEARCSGARLRYATPGACDEVTIDQGNGNSGCVCPAIYQPVCGSDGTGYRTYPNACDAGCSGADVVMCPQVVRPVCGEDGESYSNACEAACAGTRVISQGRCDAVGIHGGNRDCGLVCPQVIQTVCGNDGNTYNNPCDAACAGAEVISSGACDAVGVHGGDQGCLCPQVYRPVCGTDGNTYPNRCEALCAGADVRICSRIYRPVCGDDGNSYPNPCEAECAGATVISDGRCDAVGIHGGKYERKYKKRSDIW